MAQGENDSTAMAMRVCRYRASLRLIALKGLEEVDLVHLHGATVPRIYGALRSAPADLNVVHTREKVLTNGHGW